MEVATERGRAVRDALRDLDSLATTLKAAERTGAYRGRLYPMRRLVRTEDLALTRQALERVGRSLGRLRQDPGLLPNERLPLEADVVDLVLEAWNEPFVPVARLRRLRRNATKTARRLARAQPGSPAAGL